DAVEGLADAATGANHDRHHVEEVGQGAFDDVLADAVRGPDADLGPERAEGEQQQRHEGLAAQQEDEEAGEAEGAVDGAAGGVAVDGEAAGVAREVDLPAVLGDPLGAHEAQHGGGVAHAHAVDEESTAPVRVAPTSRARTRSPGSLASARYMRMPAK